MIAKLLKALAPYKKAVAGFVSPGVALFVVDVAADQALPTHGEWGAIGLACLAGAFGVYAAPKNSAKKG
jgi:hypothetical protein